MLERSIDRSQINDFAFTTLYSNVETDFVKLTTLMFKFDCSCLLLLSIL